MKTNIVTTSYESESESCLLGPVLCNPMDCTVHGILQARILEWVVFPFSRGSSQPRFPALQVDSLPAEPQGKPKNIGMGNLSFLQRIFPTQESDWGLLHCWRSLPTELSGNNLSLNLALNSIDDDDNKKEQLLSSALSPVLKASSDCSRNPLRSVILSSPFYRWENQNTQRSASLKLKFLLLWNRESNNIHLAVFFWGLKIYWLSNLYGLYRCHQESRN